MYQTPAVKDTALHNREVMLVNELLNQAGVQSSLSDVQELVLRECFLGSSYQDMADRSNYEYGYLKKVGSQLWRSLSQCLDKKISKGNVRSLLQHQLRQDIYDIAARSLN